MLHYPAIFKESSEGFPSYSLEIGFNTAGKPEGQLGKEGKGHQDLAATASLEAGVWSHLALTYDGVKLRLYVNDELVASKYVEKPKPETAGPLTIGCAALGAQHFKGRIDEVRIYDRAIGLGEVAADMGAPIQTPQTTPVADYPLDEGEGTVAHDDSDTPIPNQGTLSAEGVPWAPGKYGDALKLDGTKGCVSIPDAENLQLREEFTLESWVRPEGELFHYPAIFKESSEGFPSYGLGVGFNTAGKPEGQLGKEGKGHQDLAAGASLEANVWAHLALTYDGVKLRLYVNGELATTKFVEKPSSSTPGPLKIGCATLTGYYFKGRIDEVRIYNRALGAGEVAGNLGPQGMTATYISDEEGEEVEAEATSVYPQTGTGASATPIIETSVTIFGAPISSQARLKASPSSQSEISQKPYQFARCEYSHNEPGVVDPGSKNLLAPSRETLMKIAHEAAASAQKAAKTTKPHGFPNCNGTYDDDYFHFQWGVEVWGNFFYERNRKVWIEEEPQCESWAPEAVELEQKEYEQEVREGRNPHQPKRQDARPKEELCFAPQRESTAVPGGIDVVFHVSWRPAYLFRSLGSENEKVCGDFDGHLTPNPPTFEENGLRQVYKTQHLYAFYEDKTLPCNWNNPGGKLKEY